MNRIGIVLLKAIPLILLFRCLHAEAATIRVLVLSGKDGKPVQGRTVEILPPGTSDEPLTKGTTDRQGIFETNAESLPNRIGVYIKGRFLCKGNYIGVSRQALDEIVSVGVVESNDCNSKINHEREPGVLIIFVRRENLSEIFD